MREQLISIGYKSSPKTLGIEKEIFHISVIHAVGIRLRFTIL